MTEVWGGVGGCLWVCVHVVWGYACGMYVSSYDQVPPMGKTECGLNHGSEQVPFLKPVGGRVTIQGHTET